MRLPRRCRLLLIALPMLALVGAAAERAAAQASDYPSRPVSFIVPFAPGGVTSLFARILGQELEQRLGKPFVVENRPGGGGTPGDLQAFMASEAAKWGPIIKAANITME